MVYFDHSRIDGVCLDSEKLNFEASAAFLLNSVNFEGGMVTPGTSTGFVVLFLLRELCSKYKCSCMKSPHQR